VRLYEEERNLLSYLVVDTSGSMEFAGVRQETDAKLVYGCRLAAAMAYLVIAEGDEVGLSLVGQGLQEHLAPGASWQHLASIANHLGRAEAAGKTDLGGGLRRLYQQVKRRGVVVVISDFLDHSSELWQAVDLFRRSRFDVLLFHVVHPEELELPKVPLARFRDTEGEAGDFRLEPDEVRELYRERFEAFLRKTEALAKKRGCDWFLARTDQDPYRFLEQSFLSREARR
jgi:uncharacterized protein (DUF58 family)